MTLSELSGKFFTRPTIAPPTKMYIFDSEDDADKWIECMYFGCKEHAYDLIAVHQSVRTIECTMKEKWYMAEVQQFYAVEPDVIVVVVEPYQSERRCEE